MDNIGTTPTLETSGSSRMSVSARIRCSAIIGIVLVLFAGFYRQFDGRVAMSLAQQAVAFASFAAAAYFIGWSLETRRIAKGAVMSHSTRMTTVTVLGLLLAMPVEKFFGIATEWYFAVWLACNVGLMLAMYPKHWASK